ncbi:carbon storage regulator [Caproiciproducens galactitolivorans]|uniref:Translational regulator CsrA n=1 Tax=Caproiciproducens galactitolivorans TaxID=642589 RepID=A0ABT4BQ48_9FIRM|nr:carbon storage regulator [Caproiciproducens galactitolivorans]MCY1713015.1 carbon storage regulator [Caproiciproducens galactitolivorans]
MLVISRKVSESILIGDNIEIMLSEISGDRAKICISAPKEIPIIRKELVETRSLNEEASVIPQKQTLDKLKKLLK